MRSEGIKPSPKFYENSALLSELTALFKKNLSHKINFWCNLL